MYSLAEILPVIYNAGFIILFVLWLLRKRLQVSERINRIPVSYLWSVSLCFFFLMTIANFTFLVTDVDDAITSAVKAFLTGANPYADHVVLHHLPDGEWILSVYHYFPPDLLVYSTMFLLLLPINVLVEMLGFETAWLFIANLILAGIIFYLISLMVPLSLKKRMPPLFLILVSPFLYNNAILMLLFYTCAVYAMNKLVHWSEKRNVVVQTFNFLSAGVKYMTGVFVLIEFIHELVSSVKGRKVKNLLPYVIAGTVFALLVLPFGFYTVFEATILYQVHPSYRERVAESNGPLLVEILSLLNLGSLYLVFFILIGIIALILVLTLFRSIHEQQVVFSFILMFILPFYGTELFIIPLFAIFYVEFLKLNNSFVKIIKEENPMFIEN